MSAGSSDLWQIEVPTGEVYEVELDVLKQWIAKGHVQPASKVRKGNLRWVEAGCAPTLRQIFPGASDQTSVVISEIPIPQTQSKQALNDAASVGSESHNFAPHTVQPPAFERPAYNSAATHESALKDDIASAVDAACYNHPQTSPVYICRMCAAKFCRECPKFMGTTKVALCPLCGDLCKPYAEVCEKVARADYQTSEFGFADFKRALRYPFAHMWTLLAGAVVYGLLLLAGFHGQIFACALLFGCISHAINNIVAGKFKHSFLPEFDMASWWDEIGNPLFLSLGIIIVTWGPTIVLAIALLSGTRASSPLKGAIEAQQSKQQAQTKSDLAAVLNPDGGNQQNELEAMRRLDPLRANQDADANDKTASPLPNTKVEAATNDNLRANLFQFVGLPMWAILLWLLALGWAVFYYPMALAVAGYTENFASVINPLIGLDTIRRMGTVYGKAFVMYLCVQAFGIAASLITSSLLSSFDLPFIGNLPARFASGAMTFYTSLVIAFILGLALYKCADNLDLNVD